MLVILFGGSSGRTYNLIFENGGQLVSGNQVLVAGQQIGTVNSITLTDDRNADVSISVDEPLHEGTTAVIRATSPRRHRPGPAAFTSCSGACGKAAATRS